MSSAALSLPIQTSPRMQRTWDMMVFEYLIWGLLACVGYTSLVFENYMQQFWILTAALGLQNLREIYLLFKQQSRHFFLKPVILGAVVVFFLQHGALTNFLYLELDGTFSRPYNSDLFHEPVWLSRTMALALAASLFYWLGYYLTIGTKLGKSYFHLYSRFWNYKIDKYKLLVGLIIGVIIKLILNFYGALGHRFGLLVAETGGIPGLIYRLKLFENLSLFFMICFLYLALEYKRKYLYWIIFILAFLFEGLLSLTAGNRSTFIFIFLGVFLVEYYHRGHLKFVWVIIGALILTFAMTVLQDFKAFAFKKGNGAAANSDPIEFIISASHYTEKMEKNVQMTKELKHLLYLKSVGRFNYVNEATLVMKYKEVEGLKPADPKFLMPFFTFPIFAIVPQYWVLGEQVEGYGSWVAHMLSHTRDYDIAMSPIAYSYLAAGPLFVMFIFFVFGILMKCLEFLFSQIKGIMAFILFLSLLKFLVLFDSIVWGTFLNIIRFGLLLPPLLWLLFRKWQPSIEH